MHQSQKNKLAIFENLKFSKIKRGVAVALWLEHLTENWETGVQSPVWTKNL